MAESNWLTKFNESIGACWGFLTRIGVLGLAVVVGGLITWEIVRQCRYDGILLEPVVVKVSGDPAGLTAEMATQQIAIYMDKIQRTGAREWRTHELSESEQSSVNLQIPGASVSVENVVRELADLFPQSRRVVKTLITSHPSGKGYTGTVVITVRDASTRAVCKADDKPEALGKMFECLATEVMKAVEPLFAASYVLSAEQEKCEAFRHEKATSDDPVAADIALLDALRSHCSFKNTRASVAAIVERGRAEDQPWVTYIYGKLHLARADAVAAFDRTLQWDEFDRAIRRFEESTDGNMPPSALEAHAKSALRIQETALQSLNVKADADRRLQSAQIILDKAADRLKEEAAKREREALMRDQAALLQGLTPEPTSVEEDRVDAMIAHLRGLVIYRKWMIEARRKDPKVSFNFAKTEEEKQRVRAALELFEAAAAKKVRSYSVFMDLGNALRALRDFDKAIANYRHAGDIAPKEVDPPLNVTIAMLEKSKALATAESPKSYYEAMRYTSSYLTWVSDGGPFDNLVDRIKDSLASRGDNRNGMFDDCRSEYKKFEKNPERADMTHTAALRLCVNKARSAKRAVNQQKDESYPLE